MKITKLLALLVTAVLLAASVCTGLADDAVDMDTTLLKAMDMSAEEWAKSATMREYLAAIAVLELAVSDGNTVAVVNALSSALSGDNCYVATGLSGLALFVLFFGDDATVMISYIPLLDKATWTIADASPLPILAMASLKSNDTIDEYYTLDADKVMSLMQTISSLIDD